jgi:hypothetical protein
MSVNELSITWDAGASALKGVEELDSLLDKLAAECGSERRTIVIVQGPAEDGVYHGVGGDMSFVSSRETPYLTTVGDGSARGEIDYYFEGHHSPILRRNLIPTNVAREIIREFVVSGRLPKWQTWEPIEPEPHGV